MSEETTEKAQTKDRETKRQRQQERDCQRNTPRQRGAGVGGEWAGMPGTEGQTEQLSR